MLHTTQKTIKDIHFIISLISAIEINFPSIMEVHINEEVCDIIDNSPMFFYACSV